MPTLVTLATDPAILARNLAASPDLADGRLHVATSGSVAAAVDAALTARPAPVAVVLRPDVWLPEGWLARLAAQIDAVAARDPGWGVIGAFGNAAAGGFAGRVWSSSLGLVCGAPLPAPVPAQSLDELALAIRVGSGLRVDPTLTGWAMIGTDLTLAARASGCGAWIADLPLIHNDAPKLSLAPETEAAYRHLQRKWRRLLPVETHVAPLTWHGLGLRRVRRDLARGAAQAQARAADAGLTGAAHAAALGWTRLDAAGAQV